MSEAAVADAIDFPPLQAAELDEETLDRLLFDVEHVAALTDVRVKARVGSYAESSCPTLAEAGALLKSGAVFAIQLRYVVDSRAWCDTVLRAASGFRVVRAPDASPSAR